MQLLPKGTRVVRVMPNTPALVCAVAAGASAGTNCNAGDLDLVVKMFGAVGTAMAVDESKLDAVTGLSGSGPAYGFLAIEALADGGVRAGLSRDVALKLAAQTMLGAAKMVLETGKHPGELKDQVCSPGGTTIAGVHALESGGFRVALINAVVAAASRATEMGQAK
jgi:pyrroline-5-carboxylate reductase